MADEEARLIWEIYASALKKAPRERADYLERVCGDNRSLRSRLDALLESHSLDFGEAQTGTYSNPQSGAPVEEDLTGRQIGTYALRRKLGGGGMGVVYLAHDTRLSRDVAIKVINREHSHSPESRERLRNEARIAGGLSHPGIATIYALEEIDGELYLSCEYVPGEQLRELVKSGPLPITDVIDIGLQLAKALAEAHTKGIVHRDIKPENIIKTPSGVIKVLDFGLARAEYSIQSHLTQTGMLVGTPAYLAPEQALGHTVDFRADIFTLGLLMYELASGTNPFAAKTLPATIDRILNYDPPPLSQVQPHTVPGLDEVLERCLRKDPLARYRSTNEIVDDLKRARGSGELPWPDPDHHPPPGPGPLPGGATARKWLANHQVIVSIVYLALLYPGWMARNWLPSPWNSAFLMGMLATTAAVVSLRLHLWFTALTFPRQFADQQSSTQRWTRAGDIAFAFIVIAAALGISDGHPEFAMIFMGAAVAIVVASFVIEPATARAAFRSRP